MMKLKKTTIIMMIMMLKIIMMLKTIMYKIKKNELLEFLSSYESYQLKNFCHCIEKNIYQNWVHIVRDEY